jgi:hypothetical protein
MCREADGGRLIAHHQQESREPSPAILIEAGKWLVKQQK